MPSSSPKQADDEEEEESREGSGYAFVIMTSVLSRGPGRSHSLKTGRHQFGGLIIKRPPPKAYGGRRAHRR